MKNNYRFKFRVWCNEYDEPFYYNEFGFDVHLEPNGAIVAKESCVDDEGREFWSDLSGLILEQCTGLKDMEGNLVYEGDIVYSYDNDKTGIIEFDIARFVISFPKNKTWDDLYGDFKVIGNIHENTELLKEQNNGIV